MAQKLYEEANIQDIANAIRAKNGTTTTYKTNEMAAAIRGIETSGGTSDDLATMIITGGGSGFVKIPSDVTAIRNYAFMDCDSCCLESLPEGLTYIGQEAFYGCNNLRITSIPSTVETINSGAFYGCNLLRTITFKGTPRNIASNAFGGCPKLTTINVPWAEGAVANAPWGATNATINYNYTE